MNWRDYDEAMAQAMSAGALPQIGDALMGKFVALDFLPTQAIPQVVIPLGADEEE